MPVSRFCGVYSPRHPELVRREQLDPMLAALRVPAQRFEQTFFDDARGLALGCVTSPNLGEVIDADTCNWLADSNAVVAYDGEAIPAHLQRVSGEERTGPTGARIIADAVRAGASPETVAGDFAFAAWLPDRGELYIANEPMGRRSVYYYYDPMTSLLVFASQAKSVLAHPLVPRRASAEGRALFLHYSFIPAPHTAFEGVRRLLTGDLVTMGEDGKLHQGLHWSFPEIDADRSLESWSEEVRDTLVGDVKATVKGYDRAGILFSAGIDSGLILALMNRETPDTKPYTYTAGFPSDIRNNPGDLPFAQRMAEEMGVANTQIEFRQSHFLPHLADAYMEVDELNVPVANVISINAILDQAREQGVNLCMTGLGTGDLHGLASWWKRVMWREGGPPESPDAILRVFTNDVEFIPYKRQQRLLRDSTTDPSELLWETLNPLRERMTSNDPYDLVAQTWTWVERKGIMFSYCEYITSMHPVKLRHPLAEWRTLKLALQVPSEYKASKDRAMRLALMLNPFPGMLPQWVRDRTKRGLPGYVISDHRGDFPALQSHLMSPESINQRGIFEPEYFTKLAKKKQFRKVLMHYQLWHELHIEQRHDLLDMLEG